MNRRCAPALTLTALLLGTAAAPAAYATPGTAGAASHATARVGLTGHAVAGRASTFTLASTQAASYTLSFGDKTRTVHGRHGPATRIRHTFATAGWHTVTLTVTPAHGKPAVSKDKVLVLSPAGASASPVAAVAVPATTSQLSPHTSSATVTGYTPSNGVLHAPVTITGTGFTSPATASFGGVVSSATVVNPTTITTSVPLSAGSGPLVVTTAGGPVIVGTFTVTVGILPTVSLGPPTTSTTIYGGGYAPNENLVFTLAGTQIATGLTASNGSFTQAVTVPAGAQPGAQQLAVTGTHSSLVAGTTFTVQTDWASQGNLPANWNTNPYENTLTPGTVADLGRAWTTTLGTNIANEPAEVKGVLYSGGAAGGVKAVNATTGAAIWTAAAPGPMQFETPAVANGYVYIGDSSGKFYALNASTGATIWTDTLGTMYYDSPIVVGTTVYVASSAAEVYALNGATGATIWTYQVPGSAPHVYASVSVAQGYLAVSEYSTDTLYVLSAATGAAVWNTGSLGSDSLLYAPTLVDGVMYLALQTGTVTAYVLSSGQLLWSTAVTGAPYLEIGAAVGNGLVYVAGSQEIVALNTGTGSVTWTYTLPPAETAAFDTGLTLADDVLYAASAQGHLVAVDARYGDVLWSYQDGGSVGGAPVVANGEVVIGDSKGALSAFTLPAGYTTPS